MTSNSENTLFQTFFNYVGESEIPLTYQRWALTTSVAAMLGRQVYFPFGHFKVYPNLYTLLTGSAGARKSSAISVATKLIAKAGYNRFAPDKCSKEQFVKSMCAESVPLGPDGEPLGIEELLDTIIETRNELLIDADEFTDFTGNGNTEFTTMLTKLWDNPAKYVHPKLNSQDVIVDKPGVNILAGCTPEGFSMAFPPEVIGQGFTSRLMFIYSEASSKKITWPKAPDKELEEDLTAYLEAIAKNVRGKMDMTEEAEQAFERAYAKYPNLSDPRFAHYNQRRFTMLIKLSVVLAAMDISTTITLKHVLQANTMLHFAECRMHKALSEYGRSKHSGQQSAILDLLDRHNAPITISGLWQKLSTDITRQTELVDIMKNLALAHKVKIVNTDAGSAFVRVHEVREVWDETLILDNFLELEEMA